MVRGVYTIELYQDAVGQWRWRMQAANGRIVADSGEGYRRRDAALKAAQRVIDMPKVLVL
jgi:uncharacterized protein